MSSIKQKVKVGDNMEIMIISTLLTVIMFTIVFIKNIKKEDIFPITINLMLVVLNIFVWVIIQDNEIKIVETENQTKYVVSVMHLMIMTITAVQFILNLMLYVLGKITKKEMNEKTATEK